MGYTIQLISVSLSHTISYSRNVQNHFFTYKIILQKCSKSFFGEKTKSTNQNLDLTIGSKHQHWRWAESSHGLHHWHKWCWSWIVLLVIESELKSMCTKASVKGNNVLLEKGEERKMSPLMPVTSATYFTHADEWKDVSIHVPSVTRLEGKNGPKEIGKWCWSVTPVEGLCLWEREEC